jgi:hypothetical protein
MNPSSDTSEQVITSPDDDHGSVAEADIAFL